MTGGRKEGQFEVGEREYLNCAIHLHHQNYSSRQGNNTLHCRSHAHKVRTRLLQGWALIQVNFDPIQEIEGGGHSLESG